MDLLRNVHQSRKTTIVLVTHDAELAAMAEARIVLRDGRVTENTLAAARQTHGERELQPQR
jgi:ABC-type lipoprotein export system ATPase subunit